MRLAKIAVLAVAALGASAAWANDATDAKAFVAGLFATYIDSSKPTAGSAHVYDAQLQALMKEDERLANGEVGALDSDPICQCQDFQKLQARVTVRSASSGSAIVAAKFWDLGMPKDKPRDAVFDLVKEHGAWRIHDIHAEDPKSLRAYLIEQNAERTHPSKHK